MISYLHGVLAEKGPARAVIDVRGVGYELSISLSTYEKLPGLGERAKLLTRTYLRDDTIQLFGFADAHEAGLFKMLVSVPKIGPKLALAILSGVRPDEFRDAVVSGNAARLSRVPGIGKKSAERLIVELKSKFEEDGAGPLPVAAGTPAGPVVEEALLALETLGVKSDQAVKAVERALESHGDDKDAVTVEMIVREALRGV
ncbi:MAG: Holliday junction branch migration protein RuvA [Gemmatimonadetes bacterium]|nr:Holliday junction branch migration protein RuvA [Gemmatimonadota bacterium]